MIRRWLAVVATVLALMATPATRDPEAFQQDTVNLQPAPTGTTWVRDALFSYHPGDQLPIELRARKFKPEFSVQGALLMTVKSDETECRYDAECEVLAHVRLEETLDTAADVETTAFASIPRADGSGFLGLELRPWEIQ